jgi:two-component system LytT family response regulator
MNLVKYSTLVIDDEEDIRKSLISRLNGSGFWDVLGEAESVTEALSLITKSHPDCIFLDIKLREGNAFSLLELLDNINLEIPPIILNTGFTEFEYAQKVVNKYSSEVIMLLKKPFWEEWDEKEKVILEKLDGRFSRESNMDIKNEQLSIRVGNKTHFVKTEDILFVEIESTNAAKCKLCTLDNVIIINKTLSKLKKILPDYFIQISRQTIINRNYIKEFDHEDHILRLEEMKDRVFDVGMVYRKNLF